MGQGSSRERAAVTLPPNQQRKIFVQFVSHQKIPGTLSTPTLFTFEVAYQRYYWYIEKRFHELLTLDRLLFKEFQDKLATVYYPPRYWAVWTQDKAFLDRRGERMTEYLQQLCDSQEIFNSNTMKLFLQLSTQSFDPSLGRKSVKEGWLKKSSGGYTLKFSR